MTQVPIRKTEMKTITFIFLLSAISWSELYCQRIPLNDLIKLIDYTYDDMDTYLVNNGFIFKPSPISQEEKTKKDCDFYYDYSYKVKGYNQFVFYKCRYDDYQPNISLRTPSENDYLLFKAELKNAGFKFLKNEDYNGSQFLWYELSTLKFKYSASLVSRVVEEQKTIYEITISREDK
jgi:hypothetical protein